VVEAKLRYSNKEEQQQPVTTTATTTTTTTTQQQQPITTTTTVTAATAMDLMFIFIFRLLDQPAWSLVTGLDE
jgi:short subunit dehydrogenase-like uncharacterized protein